MPLPYNFKVNKYDLYFMDEKIIHADGSIIKDLGINFSKATRMVLGSFTTLFRETKTVWMTICPYSHEEWATLKRNEECIPYAP